MTRKDYIRIADGLNSGYREARSQYDSPIHGDCVASKAVINTAELIALRLADDNPRFNRDHFLAVVRGEKELTSRPHRARIR